MNIEDRLNDLALEAQNIPDRLNMETITKNTKRRKTRHDIAFTVKVVLSSVAALLLVLFIGVNVSFSLARASAKLPVVGKFSSSLIVRQDIRDAVRKDIRDALAAGDFTEVHTPFSGQKGLINGEVKSVLSDYLSFVFLMDMQTDLDLDSQQYYLGDFRYIYPDIDLPKYQIPASSVNYHLGKESYVQIYDISGEGNFALEFSVFDCEPRTYFDPDALLAPEEIFQTLRLSAQNEENRKFNEQHTVETFHIEFNNVVLKAPRYYRLDQSFEYEGQKIKIIEMMLYNTGTKIIMQRPELDNFYSYGFEVYLTDENGQVIADPYTNIEAGKFVTAEDFNTLNLHEEDGKMTASVFDRYTLPSIFHQDVDKIQIHIKSLHGFEYNPDMLKIDPKTLTATFKDKSFPVKEYDSTYTYKSFGLDMPPIEGNYYFYAVPKTSDMPAFNRQYDPLWGTFSVSGGYYYSQELFGKDVTAQLNERYPTVTIDGSEYLLILFVPEGYSVIGMDDKAKKEYNMDGCYYFAATDPKEVVYDVGQQINVKA